MGEGKSGSILLAIKKLEQSLRGEISTVTKHVAAVDDPEG